MKTLVLVLALALLPSTATAQLYGGYGSFYGGYAGVLRVGYLDPAFGYRTYGHYPYSLYHYHHYHGGLYPAWYDHHGCYCR